jgi:2-iminobutanoate/2-iminopropanoate deaminase
MKKVVRTDKAPNPVGPYSQGLICGKRVYVSGQGPFNAETGTKPEGVAEQTRQTLRTCGPFWRPQAPPWTTW